MNVYQAYGLNIESSLELPELPPGRSAVDVVVQCQRANRLSSSREDRSGRLGGHQNRISLFCPGVGHFVIRRSSIAVRPVHGVGNPLLRLHLLGPAMGLLLHLRKALVLHASAIVINGQAVVIAGESGCGKSSLSSALHARGYFALSDDLLRVESVAGHWEAFPAVPQYKLWPDVVRFLGYQPGNMARIHARSTKRVFPSIQGFADRSIPICCIYILRVGKSLKIERLSPKQAFVDLMRHAYCRSVVGLTGPVSHFFRCGQVAQDVAVRRLSRTEKLATLSQLADLVEQDLPRPSRAYGCRSIEVYPSAESAKSQG
jgi:hypothetical protein